MSSTSHHNTPLGKMFTLGTPLLSWRRCNISRLTVTNSVKAVLLLVLFVTVCTVVAYQHLFHAAVKIYLRYGASVLELDKHTGTYLFPQKQ